MAFLAACTRCGAWNTVCPPHAILPVPSGGGLAAGTPSIDPDPALHRLRRHALRAGLSDRRAHPPPDRWEGYRMGALEFLPERCVTYQGTACRVCVDACPVGSGR